MLPPDRSPRLWAYMALGLGLVASVAANIAHAYAGEHAPSAGAVAASVVWPLLVLVGVELLTRTVWPRGLSWAAVRWGGVLLVAVIAAIVSYRHMSGLLASYGEDPIVAAIGPLAIDGIMVMGTAALLAATRTAPASLPAAAAVDDAVEADAVEPAAPQACPSELPGALGDVVHPVQARTQLEVARAVLDHHGDDARPLHVQTALADAGFTATSRTTARRWLGRARAMQERESLEQAYDQEAFSPQRPETVPLP